MPRDGDMGRGWNRRGSVDRSLAQFDIVTGVWLILISVFGVAIMALSLRPSAVLWLPIFAFFYVRGSLALRDGAEALRLGEPRT